MKLALILAALVATSAHAEQCSWAHPGANRYTGDITTAIRGYREIPPATRAKLANRWRFRQFSDHVTIHRSKIVGKDHEYIGLRRMHFGSAGKVCEWPDRSMWSDDAMERGIVVCADGWCVLVPSVCGNVSLVDQIGRTVADVPAAPAVVEQQSAGGSGAPVAKELPPVIVAQAAPVAPAAVPQAAPMPPMIDGYVRPPIWTPYRPVFHRPPCVVKCPKPPKAECK